MEHGYRPTLLCSLPSLLFLVQLSTWGSADEFLVTGPTDPIVAVLGGDATLPCSLSPAMNAEDMELRWFRSKFSEAVLVYQNGQEQNEELMPQYAGRTSLVRDFLSLGQAAVRIRNIQVSDNGKYTCFFQKGDYYEEDILELKVAGLGSAPQVHIEGPEKDGVRVVCKVSGWFPKPQVQWRDVRGEKFLEFFEVHTQDAAGLFSVEAAVVVRDRSAGDVTCSILNPILGQEKVMAIPIPEPFFPQASPWKAAFAVSLTVLVLLLGVAGFVTKREHFAKVWERQRQKDLKRAKEEDQQAKEEALKSKDELQAEFDRRKAAYQAAWRKAQLYADWRKEEFQAWSVTLDPDTAHADLAISAKGTSVTWRASCVNPDVRCSVLGFKSITSGRCYWEIEIRDEMGSEWTLGVCRENVIRAGPYKESPEKGFWVIGRFIDKYFAFTMENTALSPRQNPCRVGVFLDYDRRDISFYNMIDGSHMFSFSPASFSEPLFPYFSIKSGAVTLSSPVGGSDRRPVTLSGSPSLEEAGKPPGAGLNPGSGTVGALPGAESPLLPCPP
ncbi:butyrophilin-like protein 1 [Ochotona princeps]|uniref:butyrophilin-like protein 1 n=1 Tax=Ochotona princeps TaxID=9978 RepID=UPI00271469C5|nr:butyrophilin-like protein 1 [Ochotona princeps]